MPQLLQRPTSVPIDAALQTLLQALERAAAASLAGGIIASSGQRHTAAQALAVQNEVLQTMFAPPKRPSSG